MHGATCERSVKNWAAIDYAVEPRGFRRILYRSAPCNHTSCTPFQRLVRPNFFDLNFIVVFESSAQRKGSAGRRSRLRCIILVGHAFYFGTWGCDCWDNLLPHGACKGQGYYPELLRNVAERWLNENYQRSVKNWAGQNHYLWPMIRFREFFTVAVYHQPGFGFRGSGLAAQRQGSAGPWHKVFAGWRRSKYFMSWSRMHPIVGQALFSCFPYTWIASLMTDW